MRYVRRSTPLSALPSLMGEAETEEEKQQFIDIIDTNSSLLLQAYRRHSRHLENRGRNARIPLQANESQ